MYKHEKQSTGQNSPESFLSKLKYKLCIALEITESTMKLLVDKFVLDNFGNRSVGSHYMRVNTYNELSSGRMTVKVFFKFLHIIQIRRIEFNLKVTTRSGKIAEITEEVNFAEDLPNRLIYSHKSMEKSEDDE